MSDIKHNWSREDFLIALDVYLTLKEKNIPINKPESPEASPYVETALALINSLPIHHNNKSAPIGSLQTYIQAFATFDEDYEFNGPYATRKELQELWDKFYKKPTALRKEIESLRQIASLIKTSTESEQNETDTFQPIEGTLKAKYHYFRERNKEIVRRKKSNFLNKYGQLFCEACGFDFVKSYGKHGEGFIECHHKKLISELDGQEHTRLEDLVLLCANCHRMIHYREEWLSFEELKIRLEGQISK